MKPRLLLSLALAAFASQALALPGDENQPLLGEARDSGQEIRAPHLTVPLLERRHGR